MFLVSQFSNTYMKLGKAFKFLTGKDLVRLPYYSVVRIPMGDNSPNRALPALNVILQCCMFK